MVQKGFETTASKDDIRQLERRIDGVELKISAYASRWNEDFDRLHGWVMQIEDRLKIVENKSKR